jgi:hypothetical protein
VHRFGATNKKFPWQLLITNMSALTVEEREAQKQYWLEHSAQPTVEAMMLDSKAAEIDQLERPEVRWQGCMYAMSNLSTVSVRGP